jgi:hypothetical protein
MILHYQYSAGSFLVSSDSINFDFILCCGLSIYGNSQGWNELYFCARHSHAQCDRVYFDC